MPQHNQHPAQRRRIIHHVMHGLWPAIAVLAMLTYGLPIASAQTAPAPAAPATPPAAAPPPATTSPAAATAPSATPPAVTPSATTTPPSATKITTQTVAAGQLFGVFGRHVSDAEGTDIGKLWDVLVDHDGKPRAAIIDYGGMLGVGERKVAVAWRVVRFVPSDDTQPITLTLTKRQLGEIPDFTYDGGPIVLGDGG
jgi:hypothetical protein